MTVGWLLKIFNPEGPENNSISTSPIITSQDTRLVQPIISGGVGGFGPSRDVSQNSDLPPPPPQPGFASNSPGFFHRDFQNKDLSLPVFSADYPAFFILILLITLTMFALFVLLFLCCLDGDDLVYLRRDPEPAAPELEPPFKEVATETDGDLEQPDTVEVDANTTCENEQSTSSPESRTDNRDQPEHTVVF